MPIDRAATLRNAEKLLRTGKIDAAITEYRRVVEDQPADWNTANMLGDLYVRSNQTEKAVEQYIRIADHLNEEGFLPKASALYKKILKLKPDHEHALLQAGEIAASQGVLADARSLLTQVVAKRAARNDLRGAAQVRIRIGTLDPADYDGRTMAARARVDIGDTPGAVRDFKEMAVELLEKKRPNDALEALRQAAGLAPDDEEIRAQLLQVHVAAGNFERARDFATTADQFKDLAAKLEALERPDEALTMLRDAARVDPSDTALRTQLARTFAARGDLTTAAEYLTVESAAGDPALLMVVAEIRARAGQIDEALSIATGLLASDPAQRDAIGRLGCAVAQQSADAGFALTEMAADASIAGGDSAAAGAMFEAFAAQSPGHIPALLRLVEVSVDSSDEAKMNEAQSQLADAYLAAGHAEEARYLAEDLVARAPWEHANLERFRKSLVMLGEPDPDAVIAERLGGGTPFTSTDLNSRGGYPEFEPPAPLPEPEPEPEPAPVPEAASPVAEPPPEPPTEPPTEPPGRITPPAIPPPVAEKAPPASAFAKSAHDVSFSSLMSDSEPSPTPATAHASSDDVEVDLSIVLDDIHRPPASEPAPQRPPAPEARPPLEPAPASTPPRKLESVFDNVRDDATRKTALDLADTLYKHALALRQAGDIDGCIESLTFASRAPKYRFQTASLLGRLHRDRNQIAQAVEWFEKAAQAPAPTQEESYLLLYDLADVLERQGEIARALAICLELQAEAGGYEDVEQRIERLSKVQARG